MTDDTPTFDELSAVKNRHEDDLMGLEGVQSVGIGIDAIVVGVRDDPDQLAAEHGVALPQEIDNIPIEYDVIGEISAEPTVLTGRESAADAIPTRTDKVEPIPAGVSISHKDVTAGTSSFVLESGTEEFLASNNHVLAASGAGDIGDNIHQPGTMHHGTPAGELMGYAYLEDGATTDLAWAKITDDIGISTDIVGVEGPYGEIYDPRPGDELVASGITTGVTSGLVRQIDATVDVNYGDAGVIRLREQVITESLSAPGDSGSPVLYEGQPAGMVFAGSDTVSVIMTAANIEQSSGMRIKTTDQPAAAALEDAMWTFQARPDPTSRYEMGVYDGDTYHLVFDQGFRTMRAESVRAMHIDTAEIQMANSDYERSQALAQRDFVREWMRDAEEYHDGEWPLLVRTEQSTGKYGRWLCHVYNRREESLEAALIDEFGDEYLAEDVSRDELQTRFARLAEDL